MPLYIKDETTSELVAEFARRRGLTKQAVVRAAVKAEPRRDLEAVPLRERFAALRAARKLPPATSQKADKAFFDDLSDDL